METAQIIEEISSIVGEDNVKANVWLSQHTTFHVGGPADVFVSPATGAEIATIVRFCYDNDIPLHVLGSGSNLLVSDDGVRGVVMHIGTRFSDVLVNDDGIVMAQAGATNSKVARAALEAGFGGFEFAAGIPGTIGGAAIMNAGAYDGELRDVGYSVVCVTPNGDVGKLTAAQAGWGYRTSHLADAGYIVLSVEMRLKPRDPEEIRATMDDLAQRRRDKQPLDLPSAGSTFKRPEGDYAGRLIQEAGMQGYKVGGAQVSTKHAGFVVNAGGATAGSIRTLIDDVIAAVEKNSGVTLEPEVKMWGFEDDL